MKEKVDVNIENDILYFETKSMRLELYKKINLNSFVEFFMTILVEFIIAKYKLDNKKTSAKLRSLVKLN